MRDIARRAIRLEVRAAAVIAETTRAPPILCFVNTDMNLVSEFNMGTGVWTHFNDKPGTAAAIHPCEPADIRYSAHRAGIAK